jgi:VanZ family protein
MGATTAVRSVMHGDKIAHFFLFGALGFVLNLTVSYRTWRWFGIPVYRGTALVLLFTIVEDFSQHFISHRNFDLQDLLADVLGLLFFAVITRCVYYRI